MASDDEYQHQRTWIRKGRDFLIKPKSIKEIDVTADVSSIKYIIKEKINIKPNKQ